MHGWARVGARAHPTSAKVGLGICKNSKSFGRFGWGPWGWGYQLLPEKKRLSAADCACTWLSPLAPPHPTRPPP